MRNMNKDVLCGTVLFNVPQRTISKFITIKNHIDNRTHVLNILMTQLSTTLVGMKIDTASANEVERQAQYEDRKHSHT